MTLKPKVPNKPCVRCLIRDISDGQAAGIIEEYKKNTPPGEVVPDEVYEERLSVCRDCKWLNMGVCVKCGAYVEARAYRSGKHCPLELF